MKHQNEMLFLRRMLRTPWTARVSSEEVTRRAGVERRRLLKSITKKQLEFVGHITRTERSERNGILGRVGGA